MTGSEPRLNPARRVPFPLYDEEEEDQVSTIPGATTPSLHFLAQRPPGVSLSQQEREPSLPDTSTLAAADFDVSVETGFLPPQEPVQSLSQYGKGWEEFENCLQQAAQEVQRISGGGVGKMSNHFRNTVKNLPTVDCTILTTLPLLRRAHTLLAHLTHYYMHSSFPSETVVPRSLSIPLVFTSSKLGIPPILTYADTVLWVWKLIDPKKPLKPDNVDITTLFTHSPSEKAFFLLSLYCELKGPNILRFMSSTLDEIFFNDLTSIRRIENYLNEISKLIDELKFLFKDAIKGEFGPITTTTTSQQSQRQKIEPGIFYWEIRPWFNGGKWIYESVGEMEFGGPSAGQSSLIHAIDLFLGIDHSPRGGASGGLSDSTFMQRMSAYMPHHHREFLQHLSTSSSSLPSLRSLVLLHPESPTLRISYDRAVNSMKQFRDTHIILATHFIVSQARHPPSRDSVHFKEWETKRLIKEQSEMVKKRQGKASNEKDVVVGTGGTDLSNFLKLCRDRTKEALIDQ